MTEIYTSKVNAQGQQVASPSGGDNLERARSEAKKLGVTASNLGQNIGGKIDRKVASDHEYKRNKLMLHQDAFHDIVKNPDSQVFLGNGVEGTGKKTGYFEDGNLEKVETYYKDKTSALYDEILTNNPKLSFSDKRILKEFKKETIDAGIDNATTSRREYIEVSNNLMRNNINKKIKEDYHYNVNSGNLEKFKKTHTELHINNNITNVTPETIEKFERDVILRSMINDLSKGNKNGADATLKKYGFEYDITKEEVMQGYTKDAKSFERMMYNDAQDKKNLAITKTTKLKDIEYGKAMKEKQKKNPDTEVSLTAEEQYTITDKVQESQAFKSLDYITQQEVLKNLNETVAVRSLSPDVQAFTAYKKISRGETSLEEIKDPNLKEGAEKMVIRYDKPAIKGMELLATDYNASSPKTDAVASALLVSYNIKKPDDNKKKKIMQGFLEEYQREISKGVEKEKEALFDTAQKEGKEVKIADLNKIEKDVRSFALSNLEVKIKRQFEKDIIKLK